MVICDQYNQEPSDQMAFEGLDDKYETLMNDCRKWVAEHFNEWAWYKRFAYEQGKDASPNFCLQSLRGHFKCSMPNSWAPALARIALEEFPTLSFRLAKSKLDAYTTAVLR